MLTISSMKRTPVLTLLLFWGALTAGAQGFYDAGRINIIELTFRQANWDFLLDSLVAAGNEDRLLGTAKVNGQVFDSVGVRYKGNSSYRANQVKNPFNIKLDYVKKDQKLEGYGTIKLANGFKDPTFVREALGYEIARKYMPASLSNHAKVYVNGVYLGLYTNDQDVDRFFMQTHFQVSDNVRVKGELSGGGPGGLNGVWQYAGTDSTTYFSRFEIESDFGWKKLIGMLDTLSNHNEYLHTVLNIDRHLWFLAFENLLVNLDSPINNPQNHYIFEDGCHRFNPVPWDLNECFGVFQNVPGQGPLSITQLQQFSPFFNASKANYPILSKVLNDPVRRKMYVAHMKTMMAENFFNGWYLDRAGELQSVIDADVQGDPNKFYSYANFKANVNSQVGSAGPPPNFIIPGIAQLMETRIPFLASLPEFSAPAPGLSGPGHQPAIPRMGDELTFTVSATGATEVHLVCRVGAGSCFEAHSMYDDGTHGDGGPGYGVFGCRVQAAASFVDYYFYALNADAARFLPERAANEYFTLSLAGDLVINEFMAANQETAADQDGEYDDWIELYNNGSQAITLQGYALSDDAADPRRWVFPDTTIAPGGYLVVWADDDAGQAGLHATFKLSQDGETILLSDDHQSVIGQVNFPAQATDVSTGRYPNGTGDFMAMPPTFGAENRKGTSGNLEPTGTLAMRVSPNPTTGWLTVDPGSMPPGPCTLILVGASGRVIRTIAVRQQPVSLDVSTLSPGLYFLRLRGDRFTAACKLVKE